MGQVGDPVLGDFFIFLFFNFVFYKNIFLFLKFTGIYSGRPAAGRPAPGRPAAGRQGLFCETFYKKFAPRSLEDRSPGSGAAASPPLYKGLAATPPLVCLTKNLEKKKREEGGRGGVREKGEAAKPCRIFMLVTAGN